MLHDFYDLWPQKFKSLTNGITPRRWLLQCNPRLSQLISETIGQSWITHLEDLKQLEDHLNDETFCQAWRSIKQTNKWNLANHIKEKMGLEVNPDSMF